MKLYVVQGMTESGDDYFYIWQNKPTYDVFKERIMIDWPDEFEDGEDSTMNLPGAATVMETED